MSIGLATIDCGVPIPAQDFCERVAQACQPVLLKNLVGEWPAVRAARESVAGFIDYVTPFASDAELEVFVGAPAIGGKYFYGPDLAGFNFERTRGTIWAALELIAAMVSTGEGRTAYIGSVPVDLYLPGFSGQNIMALPGEAVSPRIWIGNRSDVSCHYDTLDNIACVVAGTRRFTLYPPEVVGKLYAGPIDNTIAGQPVSLAATAPDPVRYPLFEEVRDRAVVVELQAGDALYLPKLWWHRVEATAPFNVLVNYWWDAFSAGADAPYTAMLLAMIAIAERPPAERRAWAALFEHYVFRGHGHPLAHLPDEQHGLLGPLRPQNYGRIRAHVMHMLRGG